MERDNACSDERVQFIFVLISTKGTNELICVYIYDLNLQVVFFFISGLEDKKEVLTIGRIKNGALLITSVSCGQLPRSQTEGRGGAITPGDECEEPYAEGSPCTWDLGGVALLYVKCSKTVVSREKQSSTLKWTGLCHSAADSMFVQHIGACSLKSCDQTRHHPPGLKIFQSY